MFSEYASRFLAQSQSRLLSSQTDPTTNPNPLDHSRAGSSRTPSRRYLQRQPFGNPYQGTVPQASRFPFASRFSTAANTPAPLFFSATDDFREEDDGQEHEREVADFYTLQRSRRDFGTSRLTESSESEEGLGQGQEDKTRQTSKGRELPPPGRGRGIRSSWTGDDFTTRRNEISEDTAKRRFMPEAGAIFLGGKGKDRLVDVELGSTIHEEQELLGEENGGDVVVDVIDDPPTFQQFRRPEKQKGPIPVSEFLQREPDRLSEMLRHQNSTSDTESAPPTIQNTQPDPPRHDAFWATLFLICVSAVFATFLLVCLHTSAPGKNGALGDTVYTTLHSSFYLLAVDTFVATIVALLWLATLRSFVRPLVLGIMVAVPTICFAFTLYPLISSYKGSWDGKSIQDKAMRWLSVVPALFAIGWTYTAYKSRHSLGRAIELLEFATRVLAASPALILAGFATLAGVVAWTWIWLLMFARVFLGGHITSSATRLFVIDTGTWWLGAFFVLTYLWTLGVAAGIQRATTAATVSQWYFHRLATPAPPSQRVVRAALDHATTTVFGTICLATLLSLAIRLPLLVLPRRIAGWLALALYSLVPASIATLTNPLALSYAAIHSQPLGVAARALADMSFISSTSPTTTLTPRAAARAADGDSPDGSGPPLLAYRLAKLLLHATRFIAAVAFGIGGWVSMARGVQIAGSRGSLYAYVVGLVAGAIGWGVLGAMEGVLGGVLDAVVVCWGSEVGRSGGGGGTARYCREAGELLGGEGRGGGVGL